MTTLLYCFFFLCRIESDNFLPSPIQPATKKKKGRYARHLICPTLPIEEKTITVQQQSIQHYPFCVAKLEDSIIVAVMALLFLLPRPHSKEKQTALIPFIKIVI